MKQSAGLIRVGWVIEFKGKAWTVAKAQHVKPGKGGAFIQAELKAVEEGTKTNERFRVEDTVEKLMVEDKPFQFLFEDPTGLTFMDNETYEQLTLPSDVLGDIRPFLVDGMQISLNFIDGKPVSVDLPNHVVCGIEETEPVVKGQTATGSFKPAILDNGVRIMVPQFISTEDRVVVATSDATYVERAK